MLLAMLNCTMMLIAVMKYDCVNRPIPFDDFWQTRWPSWSALRLTAPRCEADWRFSYRCFSLGMPRPTCREVATIGPQEFPCSCACWLRYGRSCFAVMSSVPQIGWCAPTWGPRPTQRPCLVFRVVFAKYDSRKGFIVEYRDAAASVVTVVATLCLLLWFFHTKAKWGGFVHNSALKMVDPENGQVKDESPA